MLVRLHFIVWNSLVDNLIDFVAASNCSRRTGQDYQASIGEAFAIDGGATGYLPSGPVEIIAVMLLSALIGH